MKDILNVSFDNSNMIFKNDGWFNATIAAIKFGKEPYDWLRQKDTVDYVIALSESISPNSGFVTEFNDINNLDSTKSTTRTKLFNVVKKTGLVKTKAGSLEIGGGTWLHPKLAIVFARWLNVKFAVWCDEQISNILQGKHPYFDYKRARHDAALTYKIMSDFLEMVRADQGKDTQFYHYSNEALMLNEILTGQRKPLERDKLNYETLSLLSKLEKYNYKLLCSNLSYQERKIAITEYFNKIQQIKIVKYESEDI